MSRSILLVPLALMALLPMAPVAEASPRTTAPAVGAPLGFKARAKRALTVRQATKRAGQKEPGAFRRKAARGAAALGGALAATGVTAAGAVGVGVAAEAIQPGSGVFAGLLIGGVEVGAGLGGRTFLAVRDALDTSAERSEQKRSARAQQGRWTLLATRFDPTLTRSPFAFKLSQFRPAAERRRKSPIVRGVRARTLWVHKEVALVRTASGPEIFLPTAGMDGAARDRLVSGRDVVVDVKQHPGGGVVAANPRFE